jgi:hypothetical protein
MLHRFWFEFLNSHPQGLPPGLRMGCGITAFSEEDAVEILREKVFQKEEIAPITKKIIDVNVSLLDPGHILPNIENPAARGVWFPIGYR